MNNNMHATIFLYLLLLLQIFIVCGDATINNNNNNLVNFLNLNLPYPSSKIPTGQDGQIYVFSEYNQTLPDRVTIATLSGNIARHSPKIYTIKSQNGKITNTSVDEDTTVFWLHDLKTHHNISFNYTYMHDINRLIRHFADIINGIVISSDSEFNILPSKLSIMSLLFLISIFPDILLITSSIGFRYTTMDGTSRYWLEYNNYNNILIIIYVT